MSSRVTPLTLRLALGAWFAGMLAIGAGLLAKHVVALPAPTQSPRLGSSLAMLRDAKGHGHWLAVHVLNAECRCSQRIVAHLLSSPRPQGWEEIVLWAGEIAPDSPLLERFEVRRVTRAKLAGFGIAAAPALVVLDGQDQIRYSGGYTDRKQGPVIDDLRILSEAQHGSAVSALPVFGCAVSDELRRALARLPSP